MLHIFTFLIVPPVMALIMAWFSWKKRYIPGALPLALIGIFACVRSSLQGLYYLLPSLSANIEYILFAESVAYIIPIFFIIMILEMSGNTKKISRSIYIVFSVEILFYYSMLWTNNIHGLMIESFGVQNVDGHMLPMINFGTLIIGLTIWRILLVFISFWLLIRIIATSSALHRNQAILILLSLIPAFITISIHALNIVNIDYTPVAFIFTCLLLSVAIIRHNLFDIMPLARSLVVEKMIDGILVLDVRRSIVDINSSGKEYLYNASDLAVKNKYTGEKIPNFIENKLIFENESICNYCLLPENILWPNSDKTIRITQTPLTTKDFNLLGWLLTLRDVSAEKNIEIKQAEYTQAIEENNTRLQQLDNMKTRFFTNIAHDFRTPLTLSMGPIQDLLANKEITLPPDTIRAMQLALRNNERLLQLIAQLLDLAKLEEGNLPLNAKKYNIIVFLKQQVEQFNVLTQKQSIRVNLYTLSDEILVTFDSEKLEQVITNLLSNAYNHTPVGGKISITVTPEEDRVLISIEDNGCGISEQEQPYVFDRFYQAENSHSNETGEGSGVGLALCREIIELHSGEIRLESTLNEGSRFTIYLAYKAAVESNNSNVEIPQITVSVNKNNVILLVDDNEDMREYIRDHLGDNYRLMEAKNGADGLAVAQETIPDLIVSDVMMPMMNGLDLCDAIKNDPRTDHIPVILLTAKSGMDSRVQGLELGADEYLSKPFVVRELKARISSLLLNRNKLQLRYSQHQKQIAENPVSPFLQKIDEIINVNLEDESFHVSTLANEVAMSERQFQRKLKALTNITPVAYLRRFRLNKAAHLLKNNEMTASQVCYAVGFNSASYFSRCFREQYGCSPKEYR